MTIKKNQIDDFVSDSTQTELDGKLSLDGTDVMSGNLAMGGNNIVGGGSVAITGSYTGTDYNGVPLTTAGASTNYLDEQGNYTIPPSASAPVDSVNSQTGVVVLDTGDIAEVTDKNYVTDAQQTVIGNTSGINTGDQTNITGNAATVTTNANLTGNITSVGNATTIAAKAVDITMLADGTDGELITWDASGVADTVATGTAAQVLTSNGVGAAPTFQDAGGGGGGGISEEFSAYILSGFSVTSTETTILYNGELIDAGSNFSTGTGEYTVPSDGLYRYDVILKSTGGFTDQNVVIVQIQKNGTSIRDFNMRVQNRFTYAISVINECSTSDVIKVTIRNTSASSGTLLSGTDDNAFFGYKLK